MVDVLAGAGVSGVRAVAVGSLVCAEPVVVTIGEYAQGRGISLSVKQDGAAADLTGAKVYLVWRHRELRKRGTTEFEAVDASAGTFAVYYPAAMACAEGTVDAQIMVSEGDNAISSRTFEIRVEQVLVGGDFTEDGFTLFVEAIKAYENATELDTSAVEACNASAEAANTAATEIKCAVAAGEFADADGEKGEKGDKGDTGPAGASGTTFTPAPPLSLVDGSLFIDLSAYVTKEWVAAQYPDLSEVSY